MKFLTFIAWIAALAPALAATPSDILHDNTQAIVYLEIDDADGHFADSGTGFIVSHDGYVVTAAHLKVELPYKMWAVIGQRDGTRFPLQLREVDQNSDVALWQLPQSASCRYAVTLSSTPVKVLDRAIVIGFPGQSGMTPAPVNIANLSDDQGFYNADGFLRPGFSGGPVFNEDGKIIALVHGGTAGGGNNSLVPAALIVNLLKKRGVQDATDTDTFDKYCGNAVDSKINNTVFIDYDGPHIEDNPAKLSEQFPGGHWDFNKSGSQVFIYSSEMLGIDVEVSALTDVNRSLIEKVTYFFNREYYSNFYQQKDHISGSYSKVKELCTDFAMTLRSKLINISKGLIGRPVIKEVDTSDDLKDLTSNCSEYSSMFNCNKSGHTSITEVSFKYPFKLKFESRLENINLSAESDRMNSYSKVTNSNCKLTVSVER